MFLLWLRRSQFETDQKPLKYCQFLSICYQSFSFVNELFAIERETNNALESKLINVVTSMNSFLKLEDQNCTYFI